jgi:hypothetical protein
VTSTVAIERIVAEATDLLEEVVVSPLTGPRIRPEAQRGTTTPGSLDGPLSQPYLGRAD